MAGESYNEHRENSTDVIKIDEVIRTAKLDEEKLYSSILGGKTDAINNFYKIEGNETVFDLNHVRDYLYDVYQRLSGMKVQKFGEISKEKNFTGTILAIQIVLKALKTNPTNPKEYNIGKIDGEYNDITKNAIQQFQTDCSLTWKDGKPGKETIGRLIKELDNLINNKRLERGGQETLKADITGIIEESIAFNPYSGIYSKEQKEIIINYILNGKLNSGEISEIEAQIKTLSNNMMNWKLKYLIQHSNEPLKNNIQNIKTIESEKRNQFGQGIEDLSPTPNDKKESLKKGGNKISEDMFQQLLIMEGGQGYKAQVHREFRERFPTGPYGMVFKHIDQKGNLLKDIVPFRNGERVSKEWALNNARAYYNKRAQEWKGLLDEKGYKYNQAQLDSLVSASGGTEKATETLKNFVLGNRNDKNKIFNFMITFARTAKGKVQGGLIARRKFEANWFMGIKKSYREYQEEYAQNKKKRQKK